jgi:hypothetical protein
LWVIFALLDPDPQTRLNTDPIRIRIPDPDPDPQPCREVPGIRYVVFVPPIYWGLEVYITKYY